MVAELVEAMLIIYWLLVVRTSVATRCCHLFPLPATDETELGSASAGHVVAGLHFIDPATAGVALLPQPVFVFGKGVDKGKDNGVEIVYLANMVFVGDHEVAAEAAGDGAAVWANDCSFLSEYVGIEESGAALAITTILASTVDATRRVYAVFLDLGVELIEKGGIFFGSRRKNLIDLLFSIGQQEEAPQVSG